MRTLEHYRRNPLALRVSMPAAPSWKLMALNAGYLFALAYLASLLTYQIARALGAG